jgi:hypothetical protein
VAAESGESPMSSAVRKILDERLSYPLARKAKSRMLRADELEQLLYDAGADMAEVQAVMDEYKRPHGG